MIVLCGHGPIRASAGAFPLDGLSGADMDKVVHGHWFGGQMHGDFPAAPIVGKRASDGDTEEITSLAQLASWSAGTSAIVTEIRDTLSGASRHLTSIGDATASVIYESAAPILAPNGRTLASRVVSDSALAYTRGDILGLSGTGALQVMSRCCTNADVFGYSFVWAFFSGNEDIYRLYGEHASDDTPSNSYGYISVLGRNGSNDVNGWAYWGYFAPSVGNFSAPNWVDIRKPAGGTAANLVAKWNGVDPVPERIEGTAGTFTLAGATSFGVYGWVDPDAEAPTTADAMLVLNAQLSAPGQAIADAFFASLVTP